MKHVSIIGGGISGLATAYFLQKELGTKVNYSLIERSGHWGGKIDTIVEDGYIIEKGPDSFIIDKPDALNLCDELGLTDQLMPSNPHEVAVWIYKKGRLRALPKSFRLMVPTQLGELAFTPLLSPGGKIRMGREMWVPARREDSDESVASFIERRFGRETLDYIAGPMMGGIYSTDPAVLSMETCFKRFQVLEQKYGSLIKGMMAAAKARKDAPAPRFPSQFVSLKGGMGTLVKRLLEELNGELLLDTSISSLAFDDGKVSVEVGDGRKIESDAVVMALPSFAAADLLTGHHTGLCDQLRDIKFVSTATVSMGFQESDLASNPNVSGNGILVPRCEELQVNACTFVSNKFDHRVPNGQSLMRLFLGGSHKEDFIQNHDNGEIIEHVLSELKTIMGLSAEPIRVEIARWGNGNPVYEVGHQQRIDALEETAKELGGLYFTGASYRGGGLPNCIGYAQETVASISRQFKLV